MSFVRFLSLLVLFSLVTSKPLERTIRCSVQAATQLTDDKKEPKANTNIKTTKNDDCGYTPKTSILASEALIELRNKYIVFFGESTLRQQFFQLIGIIDSLTWDQVQDNKQQETFEYRRSGSRFTFYYRPYYDNITQEFESNGLPQLSDGRMPDLVVLNGALHDLLYVEKESEIQKSWTKLTQTLQVINNERYPNIPILWVPPGFIYDTYLTAGRKESKVFTNNSVSKMVSVQRDFFLSDAALTNALFYNTFRNFEFNLWNFDGIHNMERARIEARGLLRIFHYMNEDPNLWETDQISVNQVMCFVSYLIILVVCVLGEFLYRLFYKIESQSQSPMGSNGSNSIDDSHESEPFLVVTQQPKSQSQLQPQQTSPAINNNNTTKNGSGSEEFSLQKKTTINISNSAIPTNATPAITTSQKESSSNSNNNNASTSKLRRHEEEPLPRVLKLPTVLNNQCVSRFIYWYFENKLACRQLLYFGMTVIMVYLMDGPKGHYFIVPSLKNYDRDFFLFLHIIFLVVAGLTFKENSKAKDKDAILSLNQTSEWKGLMQLVFVMYHYLDAAEVYNLIRVFIDAYVWMTGYGNSLFFLRKNVFNATRVLGMLFRLNWLVFWVCLVLDQALMHYYICPLHTFFFLMCYATWAIGAQYNQTLVGRVVKLSVCLLFLMLLFEVSERVFDAFWWPLHKVLDEFDSLHNWYFRTSLDHYATWFGMLFAVCYPTLYSMLKWMQSEAHQPKSSYIRYALIGASLVVLYVWYVWVYSHDKYAYNALNPYTAICPILVYILLRNIVSFKYRVWYSGFLAWMGNITLETYIFQYHLFMIDDAKSILTFAVFANDYKLINFLVVACVYVYLSHVAFHATNVLRNYFYPPRSKDSNLKVCGRTVKYLSVLGALYLVAMLIHKLYFG